MLSVCLRTAAGKLSVSFTFGGQSGGKPPFARYAAPLAAVWRATGSRGHAPLPAAL